jgi:hypothetical protein
MPVCSAPSTSRIADGIADRIADRTAISQTRARERDDHLIDRDAYGAAHQGGAG